MVTFEPIARLSLNLRTPSKLPLKQQPVHADALAAFNRISKQCSQVNFLQDGLATALELAAPVVGLEAGAVFLLTGDEGLKPAAQLGLSPSFTESCGRFTVSDFFPAGTPNQIKPLVANQKKNFTPGLRLLAASEKLKTIVLTPLISNGSLLGVLLFASREYKTIKPEALQFLETLGSQLGLIVENSNLRADRDKAGSGSASEQSQIVNSLHDSVAQILFASSLITDVLPMLLEQQPEEARDRIEELRRLNRSALAEIYMLIGTLGGW